MEQNSTGVSIYKQWACKRVLISGGWGTTANNWEAVE